MLKSCSVVFLAFADNSSVILQSGAVLPAKQGISISRHLSPLTFQTKQEAKLISYKTELKYLHDWKVRIFKTKLQTKDYSQNLLIGKFQLMNTLQKCHLFEKNPANRDRNKRLWVNSTWQIFHLLLEHVLLLSFKVAIQCVCKMICWQWMADYCCLEVQKGLRKRTCPNPWYCLLRVRPTIPSAVSVDFSHWRRKSLCLFIPRSICTLISASIGSKWYLYLWFWSWVQTIKGIEREFNHLVISKH